MNTRTEKKKLAEFRQPYNVDWEKLAIFRGWLSSVPQSRFRALCKCCRKEFRAHRTDLRAHAQSWKHKKNAVKLYITEQKNQGVDQISAIRSSHLDDTDSDDNAFIVTESNDTFDHYFETAGSEPEERLQDGGNKSLLMDSNEKQQFDTLPAELSGPDYSSHAVKFERAQHHYFISTQVQDMVKGVPIDRLVIFLFLFQDNEWSKCGEGITDRNGLCSKFKTMQERVNLPFPGHYKLRYETKMHFTLNLDESIFPFVEVSFEIMNLSDLYEVNLLLSPYGYMVYKK